MKILQIHKYYSKKRGGGSVTAFFEIIEMLEKHGHSVPVFSMQDEENESTPYSKYFTSHFDLSRKMTLWQKIKAPFKLIYNFEAKRKLKKLLKKERPDVAHIHNISHYLTPSIIDVLKKQNIPTVMTMHEYKLICPNYKLFTRGKICEKCKGEKFYYCFLKRCIKNSWSGSFLIMLEAYFHAWRKTYTKIDRLISPSQFLKDKSIEFGLPEDKISVIRNPFDLEKYDGVLKECPEENYFLYYGRLAQEKGIDFLIRAVAELKQENKLAGNKLVIAGKGPEEEKLKDLVSRVELQEEIKFAGFKQGQELIDLISKSLFTVLPSVWYDNAPMTVIESQLLEKPVLISDFGGTQEAIVNQETGLIFKGSDTQDLKDKLFAMLSLSPQERQTMGKKGKEYMQKINSEELIYAQLMKVYESLTKKS